MDELRPWISLYENKGSMEKKKHFTDSLNLFLTTFTRDKISFEMLFSILSLTYGMFDKKSLETLIKCKVSKMNNIKLTNYFPFLATLQDQDK